MRRYTLAFLTLLTLVSPATVAVAFTSPTVAPPGGNITAPVNVGTVNQVKNANLGVNGLAVFGNTILQGKTDFPGSGIWNSSGNVGIGTANPLYRLEVNNAMKFTNSSADTNDGVIGTAPFFAGLNIVGINTDGGGRKVSWWGSFIQHENAFGNSFIGNTNFPGSGIWNSSGKVGIGTKTPIGTLNVENGLGTATICLNGKCTASLAGATGYTGSFAVPGTTYTRDTDATKHIYGVFTVTSPLQVTVTNGLIVSVVAGGGGTAVVNNPRCGSGGDYCLGNNSLTETRGETNARLICTSVGYTYAGFNASYAGGAYSSKNGVGIMERVDGSCTSSCNAITQVTCSL